MINQLKESWASWQATLSLAVNRASLLEKLEPLRSYVASARLKMEQVLEQAVYSVPAGVSLYAPEFVMRRAANLVPVLTLRDLAHATCAPEELLLFNPFLSEASVNLLQQNILVWLRACVLEDKLGRMIVLAKADNWPELTRELYEIGRQWDPVKYPEWLVFEVEQRLQIRQVQAIVAGVLIRDPGAIAQLNMGEGKTRVILPMLVLALGRSKCFVRLHFLSPLLGEAYDYLHRVLTASLFRRRLCHLPFHRDLKLSVRQVQTIHHCLDRCAAGGGAVCVAPEHRLSMHLKWHELFVAQHPDSLKLRDAFQAVEKLPYWDILDESDEVLRHTYQLIYAVGACCALPCGTERWTAAEAVFNQLQTNPAIGRILASPEAALRPRNIPSAGVFDNLRLLHGSALEECREGLYRAVAVGILSDPPHHLRWLRDHSMTETIVQFITDPEKSLEWFALQPGVGMVRELQLQALLALRGLLACGMLVHCLCRRHSVDYGVDVRRGIKRRVAVPYRASDTPAERAEYAQPDTLIVLTLLAYFHRGLSLVELKEACRALLSLGKISQQAEYTLWFKSAQATMTPEQVSALDSVDKMDVSSEVFLNIAYSAFRYNMASIVFWLNACVFPRETMQFPQRLTANAFNLTDNETGRVTGFSGTKDNFLLMPLNVSPHISSEESTMRATDGKMLDLVFMRNKHVECLPAGGKLSSCVLDFAVSSGAVALIDAGASMAGLSNRDVAEKVLELLQARNSPLKGVVYFEVGKNTWWLLSRQRRDWPLGCSPIRESDAFVYFDESRCRGADMKLRTTATAVLTVGQDMCKDKLMQAAGRMRKLLYGQGLVFAVPAEIASKIRASNALTSAVPLHPLHLLEWTVRNAVRAIEAGLPEWGEQACHFNYTRHPQARLLNEKLQLDGLYGGAISSQTIFADIVSRQIKFKKRTVALGIQLVSLPAAHQSKMHKQITDQARLYGSDVTIVATGMDEECERELENERELEREIELQIPLQSPQHPTQWEFSALLTATSPVELPPAAGVVPLALAVKKHHLNREVSHIDWSRCGIFVTDNFMKTVTGCEGATVLNLSEYLRPVDAVVQFSSGDCLLLSEWEADKVLGLLWGRGSSRPAGPTMCPLAYLRQAAAVDVVAGAGLSRPQLLVPSSKAQVVHKLSTLALVGLDLLAGATMFPGDRRDALRALLPTELSRSAALSFPVIRGQTHWISRSDLEDVCTEAMKV